MTLSEDELQAITRACRGRSVWEWGTGLSTALLNQCASRVVSVEHSAGWAAHACRDVKARGQLIFAPPSEVWTEDTDNDGTIAEFRKYVETYRGGFDVVLIDGRARVACFEQVNVAGAPWPVVLLHDAQRAEYAPITKHPDWTVVEDVERLYVLEHV